MAKESKSSQIGNFIKTVPPPVERQKVPEGESPKPASAFKPDPPPAPPARERD